MTSSSSLMFDDTCNPLDGVEEVLTRQKWTYSRTNQDELFLEMRGKHGTYRMMFMWSEQHEIMQFCCEYDLRLADFQYPKACETLNSINYGMWVGHFHISPESMVPCFRHTQLFRGMDFGSGADHLEDLIRIAVEECDLHYPALLMLSSERTHNEDQLALALMPAQGQS